MTNELLRRYAVDGSESAFTELVRQHIDLVYSAALRQVNGDTAAAQDITQAVFADLARKASRLSSHASLTGWLYTSTRFRAAKVRRAEQRRQTHEQKSIAMSQIFQTNDPAEQWEDLRHVLDDVMLELNDTDREAVLLRYFERKPLAEIGSRLGLSENAARMRVDRALEKLRAELSKRGVNSTVTALALALTEGAVKAAPAALIAEVSKSALAASGAGSGIALKLTVSSALKWLLGAGALAGLSVALWPHHDQTPELAPLPLVAAITNPSLATNEPAQDPAGAAMTSPPAMSRLDATNKLILHVVTADSGKPIPMVDLECWVWSEGIHRSKLRTDRFGVCEVPVTRATITKLILVSEKEPFGDTRLQWHTDQGEKIPEEYTLRVPRAASIGGLVVDADGNPVAGAKIGFNNRTSVPDPAGDMQNETSNFGGPFWIETTSDSAGRWQVSRIAKEALHTLEGGADHPAHLRSSVSTHSNPEAEKQLAAGEYVFHLGRAIEVRGDVTDSSGAPVADARVRVGYASMVGTRETKTMPNGTFWVAGCTPEKIPLTADAKGFATTTVEVDLATNPGPFHLKLAPGKLLRLRVVDVQSNAIPKAFVYLDNQPRWNGSAAKPAPIQADFEKTTGADGRIEWDSAPDDELNLGATASGYLRNTIQFRPDGEEHTLVLSSGLTLFGLVTDAATGQPIPAFRIIVGWPETNFATQKVSPRWARLDRFWFKFEGGKYRHLFDEPALGGPNPGFIFKFEAEGYTPFITPSYHGGEGDVPMDVALQLAPPGLNITVLLPDGQPAAKADVGLVSAVSGLKLQPGRFSRENIQNVESLLSSDAAGHFSLSADDSVNSIVIAHPNGFIQTTPAALAADPTVQLQPWGRIEGTLLYEGQPAPGRDVGLRFDEPGYQSIYADFDSYKATTDSAGRFVFPQAPPGLRELLLRVTMSRGDRVSGWSDVSLTNLVVPAGKTLTVTATTTVASGWTVTLPPHPHNPGE